MLQPLETEHLVIRGWSSSDLDDFAALHRDPQVAFWLAGELTRPQAEAAFGAMRNFLEENHWGVWALCERSGALAGAAGLQPVKEFMPFSGVEATWRLFPRVWGRGYVTEAMAAILGQARAWLDVPEIVTFTSLPNIRSQAVMRRLGFIADPARNFDHPRLASDDPLRRHVFYTLPNERWRELYLGAA